MVAYTIPGTIATPISVTTLWATSWKASVLPPMVLTGNPADHQIDNEEIATAVSLFAVWGLDIAGGIQELIETRISAYPMTVYEMPSKAEIAAFRERTDDMLNPA